MPGYRLSDIIGARRKFEGYCKLEEQARSCQDAAEAERLHAGAEAEALGAREAYLGLAALQGVRLPETLSLSSAGELEALEKRCLEAWIPIWLHRQFHTAGQGLGRVMQAAPLLIREALALLRRMPLWAQPGALLALPIPVSPKYDDLRIWREWEQEIEKLEAPLFNASAQDNNLPSAETSRRGDPGFHISHGPGLTSSTAALDQGEAWKGSRILPEPKAAKGGTQPCPAADKADALAGISVLQIPGSKGGILLDPQGLVFEWLSPFRTMDAGAWGALRQQMSRQNIERIQIIAGPAGLADFDRQALLGSMGKQRGLFAQVLQFAAWPDFRAQVIQQSRKLPGIARENSPAGFPQTRDAQAPGEFALRREKQEAGFSGLDAEPIFFFKGQPPEQSAEVQTRPLPGIKTGSPDTAHHRFFTLWPFNQREHQEPGLEKVPEATAPVFPAGPAPFARLAEKVNEPVLDFFRATQPSRPLDSHIQEGEYGPADAWHWANRTVPTASVSSSQAFQFFTDAPKTPSAPLLPKPQPLKFLSLAFPTLLPAQEKPFFPRQQKQLDADMPRLEAVVSQPVELRTVFGNSAADFAEPVVAGEISLPGAGPRLAVAPSAKAGRMPALAELVFARNRAANPLPGLRPEKPREHSNDKPALPPAHRRSPRLHLAAQTREEAEPWTQKPPSAHTLSVAKLANEFCRWFIKRRRLKAEQEFSGGTSHGADY